MVEAVEAIVDLIARARERGDLETVERPMRARIDMEASLRVSYQSEMNWNGTLTFPQLTHRHRKTSLQHRIGTG